MLFYYGKEYFLELVFFKIVISFLDKLGYF